MDIIKRKQNLLATNNLMIPMGRDFDYGNALPWYLNIDKLKNNLNSNYDVNVVYSSPSCYAKSVFQIDNNNKVTVIKVTTICKRSVMSILNLSPTYFVSNIRQQFLFSPKMIMSVTRFRYSWPDMSPTFFIVTYLTILFCINRKLLPRP